jgi:periplasmic protein TonB
MASAEPRASESDGHVSVRVEGQHPAETPFFFEQSRKRIAPAAVASATWHAAFAVCAILLMRHSPPGGATPDLVHAQRDPDMVWLPEAGARGGGGGGGDHTKKPPRLVERPGRDTITMPVADSPTPSATETTVEPDRIEGVTIPAKSFAAAQDWLPGAIEAPAAPTTSQGPGSGNGAGTGAGPGIGSGAGSGLGDGRGGNQGGKTYQPGSGIIPPRVLREVKPQYTADAMRAKAQGTVLVACIVRPDGTVGDVQIVRPLDPTFGLDEQAIAAVKQWKFAAGTRMGQPVAVQITIELTFTLR